MKDIDKFVMCSLDVFPVQMSELAPEGEQPQQRPSRRELAKRAYYQLDCRSHRTPLAAVLDSVMGKRGRRMMDLGRAELVALMQRLGVPEQKLSFVEHHTYHAHSAAHFFGKPGEWLVLTLNGAGDDDFCTVNILRDGKLERTSGTHWKHSLGYAYSKTTQFLGMKPLEHEYKVMGLAASSKASYCEKTYNKVFKDVVWLKNDGSLQFDSAFPLTRFDVHLRRTAVGERFGHISGTLQLVTEKLVIDWVRAALQKTGIRRIMTSGGVFMNVELNKLIQEMPEVEDVCYVPSCGDETNPFGAAFATMVQAGVRHTPPRTAYLGQSYTDEQVREFLTSVDGDKEFDVQYQPEGIEPRIADLLANLNVVARFSGVAEFGARSLGNRAIFANPSEMRSFYMFNDQIKVRDFWMPFAPSVLDTDADHYLVNPKGVAAPYITTAFETRADAYDHLHAAMHGGYKSVQPQIVTPEIERYYRVLQAFNARKGIGLNIHGYPLAETLAQAIFTIRNSGLKYIALENFLIAKRDSGAAAWAR